MFLLLCGLCAAVLINMSEGVSRDLVAIQKPRFYGVRPGRFVVIYCMSSKQHLAAQVVWYKTPKYDRAGSHRQVLEGAITRHKNLTRDAFLILTDLTVQDSGVYYCRIDHAWGAGTQLQVARPVDRARVLHHSKVKDGLMVTQALMLTLFAAALLHRKLLLKRRETIYEEPQLDHIYQGLVMEMGGDDLYEELTMYAQAAEVAEAPWE
ncbi:uncharacterized protein cd79b [Entelurus aequoreus]|uniref:uncharacterized protein cd79b n=1 Tax=Entelurus aequoreus TaxID=161455 RepID=UPI002B1D234B|nr:uncharacterized protein cd79b [Entelurus aequoreus]